jgi:DHA2 family multidrug resistance protein
MAQNNDADHERRLGPISRGGIAPQPLFAVVAVLLGAFLGNFDSRLTSVGLPDLRGAFSLSFDEGAWLSTAGIGSQIFIAPAVAWLATVFRPAPRYRHSKPGLRPGLGADPVRA